MITQWNLKFKFSHPSWASLLHLVLCPSIASLSHVWTSRADEVFSLSRAHARPSCLSIGFPLFCHNSFDLSYDRSLSSLHSDEGRTHTSRVRPMEKLSRALWKNVNEMRNIWGDKKILRYATVFIESRVCKLEDKLDIACALSHIFFSAMANERRHKACKVSINGIFSFISGFPLISTLLMGYATYSSFMLTFFELLPTMIERDHHRNAAGKVDDRQAMCAFVNREETFRERSGVVWRELRNGWRSRD